MYKLLNNIYTNQPHAVQRREGDFLISIPFTPDNTEYQAYLKWLDEGNEPLPADEPHKE